MRAERTGWSSAPIAVTRPPSSSIATSRCSPEPGPQPGDELGGLLLVVDVLVAEHHAADAGGDEPVDERVGRLGDPGQADHQHEPGAVLERGPAAHRDRARRRPPGWCRSAASRGRRTGRAPRSRRRRRAGPRRAAGSGHRGRGGRGGRTGQVLRYVGPRRHPPPTRMAPVRGWSRLLGGQAPPVDLLHRGERDGVHEADRLGQLVARQPRLEERAELVERRGAGRGRPGRRPRRRSRPSRRRGGGRRPRRRPAGGRRAPPPPRPGTRCSHRG